MNAEPVVPGEAMRERWEREWMHILGDAQATEEFVEELLAMVSRPALAGRGDTLAAAFGMYGEHLVDCERPKQSADEGCTCGFIPTLERLRARGVQYGGRAVESTPDAGVAIPNADQISGTTALPVSGVQYAPREPLKCACGAPVTQYDETHHRFDCKAAPPREPPLDACQLCRGTRGGVPGNENRVPIAGLLVTMCDYCHAALSP